MRPAPARTPGCSLASTPAIRIQERHGHGSPRCWRRSSSRSSPPSLPVRGRGWGWLRYSASSARTRALSGPREPGRGSTFHLLLPRRPDDCVRQPERRPERRFDGRTVLLIEDEPNIRQLLRAILESLGMEVHEAGDGTQGIAMAQALPRPTGPSPTWSFPASRASRWPSACARCTTESR